MIFSTFLLPLKAANANNSTMHINKVTNQLLLVNNLNSYLKLFKNMLYIFFEMNNKAEKGNTNQNNKNSTGGTRTSSMFGGSLVAPLPTKDAPKQTQQNSIVHVFEVEGR